MSSRANNVDSAPRRPSVDTGATENAQERPAVLDTLEALIGRWVTIGQTAANGSAPMQIFASDVYEWAPGRRFVVHTAYGRIGDADVGGIELIGFDPETEQFKCTFFDSFGDVSHQQLSNRSNTWTWEGDAARCTGTLSADGKSLQALHEARAEDGWHQSMNVVLKKVE